MNWIITIYAHGDYGSILAEQLDHYCNSREGSSSGQPLRVGKAGPRGLPGPRGSVNYTVVDEMITRRLKAHSKTRRTNCVQVTKDSAKIKNETGGVFDIYPGKSGRKMEVYCDLTTDGGG
ncbi:uncharacterized protein LOC120330406 [Styela clava]